MDSNISLEDCFSVLDEKQLHDRWCSYVEKRQITLSENAMQSILVCVKMAEDVINHIQYQADAAGGEEALWRLKDIMVGQMETAAEICEELGRKIDVPISITREMVEAMRDRNFIRFRELNAAICADTGTVN